MDDRSKDHGHEPDPDFEVDSANDVMGGPTTGSHSAGLTSDLKPAEPESDQKSKDCEVEERSS